MYQKVSTILPDFARIFNAWRERTDNEFRFSPMQLNAQYKYLHSGHTPTKRPAQPQMKMGKARQEGRGDVDYNKSVEDLLKLSAHTAPASVRR